MRTTMPGCFSTWDSEGWNYGPHACKTKASPIELFPYYCFHYLPARPTDVRLTGVSPSNPLPHDKQDLLGGFGGSYSANTWVLEGLAPNIFHG